MHGPTYTLAILATFYVKIKFGQKRKNFGNDVPYKILSITPAFNKGDFLQYLS